MAVNKVFTLSKLEPPASDVVDAQGVVIFPSLASFSMAPPAIAKLTQEEVTAYLEAFGFATVVGKLKRPALKQLLMWKLVEEAFVLHLTTTALRLRVTIGRLSFLTAAWGAPAAAASCGSCTRRRAVWR